MITMIDATDALKRTVSQRKRIKDEAKAKAELEKRCWLDSNKILIEEGLAFVEKCIKECADEGFDFELFAFLATTNIEWKEIEEKAKKNYRFEAPWFKPYYISQNHGRDFLDYVLIPTLEKAHYKVTVEHNGGLLTVKVDWSD